MTTILNLLEMIGAFVVGLAGRLSLFLLAGLVLVLPALLLALAWRRLAARPARETAPEEARFAPGHTWLAPRGARGALAVGIDEIAGRILPSATAVELPARGMEVHRGDPIAVIRAGKRAVRIGAPVDGTILAVNRGARRDPSLVKKDPYGRGWLFLLVPASEAWKKLPGGMTGEIWLETERRRLARFVDDELGLAAADGGELVAPAPALLGEEGWRRLLAAFLHAA
jgi:glycine cleavage system H lipoate-binding protein